MLVFNHATIHTGREKERRETGNRTDIMQKCSHCNTQSITRNGKNILKPVVLNHSQTKTVTPFPVPCEYFYIISCNPFVRFLCRIPVQCE